MTDDLIKRLREAQGGMHHPYAEDCQSDEERYRCERGTCACFDRHVNLLGEAADALEALQSRLEAARELVQRIMARLADLLESDNFNNIEAMVVEAGVPYPASVPALAEEGEEDERDDSPYCECGNFPTEEEEASNRCACCGKKFDP